MLEQVPFQSLELEREAKRRSIVRLSDELEAQLLARVVAAHGEAGASRIAKAMQLGKSLKTSSPSHPSLLGYFAHPVRVALYCDAMHAPAPLLWLEIALIHNCFEVCDVSEDFLEQQGFHADVGRAIRTLTIDRAQQTDPRYLESYYGAIRAHGKSLMLIKCLDKLDNLLSLDVVEDDRVRADYLAHCRRYVVPMASDVTAAFGRYVADAVALAERSPFNAALHRDLKAFVATLDP